jgi:NAD(P)-dependent dehydrogenase (short-subunit alcohol dehydrogenase family)
MDLQGKTAIVTGAGAGLGRLLAVALARAGMNVVIADIDGGAAAGTARLVEECGTAASTVVADVRRAADASRTISAAESSGGPHVLVNNAGGLTPGTQFPDAPPDAWAATLELNLHAPMFLTQLVLPAMQRLGGGVVLNIASSAALGEAAHGSPEYAAAKAGLIRFTSAARGLDETHGVRVMCIVPDWIGLDRAIAEWNALSPVERAARPPLIPPADIVDLAVTLARTGEAGTVVELRGDQAPFLWS